MKHKQAQGEYIGGHAPYGYQLVDGELVADPIEQDIIRQAKELRDSELSLAAIAKRLDERGIRARNGKVFAATQVKRLVA